MAYISTRVGMAFSRHIGHTAVLQSMVETIEWLFITSKYKFLHLSPLYTGDSISISAQNGSILIRLQCYYNPPVDFIHYKLPVDHSM